MKVVPQPSPVHLMEYIYYWCSQYERLSMDAICLAVLIAHRIPHRPYVSDADWHITCFACISMASKLIHALTLELPDVEFDEEAMFQRESLIFFQLCNTGIPTMTYQVLVQEKLMVQEKLTNVDMERLHQAVNLCLFMNFHDKYETGLIMDTLEAFVTERTQETLCFRELQRAYDVYKKVEHGMISSGEDAMLACARSLFHNLHMRFDVDTVVECILSVRTRCLLYDNPCMRELLSY